MYRHMYTHHESVKPHCCPSFSQMADVLLAMLTSCWLRWSRGGSWKNILARLRMKVFRTSTVVSQESPRRFWPRLLADVTDILKAADIRYLDMSISPPGCGGIVWWVPGLSWASGSMFRLCILTSRTCWYLWSLLFSMIVFEFKSGYIYPPFQHIPKL